MRCRQADTDDSAAGAAMGGRLLVCGGANWAARCNVQDPGRWTWHPKARTIDDGEAEMCEIRWQRVGMSKQAQAEWLVSAVLEEAGSDHTPSRRRRKGQGIES